MRASATAAVGAAALLAVTGCAGAGTPAPPATAVTPVTPVPGPSLAVSRPPPRPAPPARPMHVQAHRLSWTLPSALSREVVIADGSSAVVAGGLMRGDISSDHVFRVTPARGSTQVLPPLTAPRHDSAGVLLGGQLLVVGGGGASELSSVESASRDERWQASAHLPRPRSDLAVVAVPDGFLVVGGYDGRRSDREVLRSRDGRRFTVAAQLRQGVRYPAVVRVGASVWVFGGEDQQQELRAVQRVDTATGSVTVDAQLPHALGHSAAALVGSRVLLMGGRTGPHRVTDQMWWFDPESKRFSRAGQLPYPVADAGLLTVGSTAYLLGGETPELTNNVTRVQLTR